MIPPKRAFSVLLISIVWSLGALAVCSPEYDCSHLQDLTSWNEEYVTSLCTDDGLTDKSTNAVLCDADKGNAAYEESLKLAILNTMYGVNSMWGPTSESQCAYFCMYDPHHVYGEFSFSFKWSIQQECWEVIFGNSDPLCHQSSIAERFWAMEKSQNWCCPADSTYSPCSPYDGCDQFQNLWSWANPEYVTSLCTNDGLTDKSTSATLCAAWQGVADYEDSLKLAIVNSMYGTGAGASQCKHWCMYDPLHIRGEDAVGFKWTNKNRCWNVVLGATNHLCYIKAIDEWSWAVSKTENWCCTS